MSNVEDMDLMVACYTLLGKQYDQRKRLVIGYLPSIVDPLTLVVTTVGLLR